MKNFNRERVVWDMFSDYPDMVTSEQIGFDTAFIQLFIAPIGRPLDGRADRFEPLLHEINEQKSVKIGRKYLIPKNSVIEYLCGRKK